MRVVRGREMLKEESRRRKGEGVVFDKALMRLRLSFSLRETTYRSAV
jgi:hypothetical protein